VGHMAPLKRPAASQQGSSQKKQATMLKEDVAPVRLMQKVSRAISTSSLPHSVKELLTVTMDDSLGAFKESRHRFQEELVQMIESVLLDEEKKLEQISEDTQKAAHRCDVEKVSQAAVLQVAQDNAEEKKQELNAKQAELATTEKDIEAKMHACKAAEHDFSMLKNEIDVATQTKEKLEAALADVVKPTKDGQEISKDTLNSFVALCTAVKCDPSLLTPLPAAFGKAAGELGPFDLVVIQQVEEFIAAQIALHKESVSQSEAKVSATQAKLEAVKEELQQFMNVKESVEADAKSAAAITEQAACNVQEEMKTLKKLEVEKESADATAEAAKAQHEKFREGTLAAFKQLAERNRAPAQEPAIVTATCL